MKRSIKEKLIFNKVTDDPSPYTHLSLKFSSLQMSYIKLILTAVSSFSLNNKKTLYGQVKNAQKSEPKEAVLRYNNIDDQELPLKEYNAMNMHNSTLPS